VMTSAAVIEMSPKVRVMRRMSAARRIGLTKE